MSEEKKTVMDESFRDSIATVTQKGERIWIFPIKPSGNFIMPELSFQ